MIAWHGDPALKAEVLERMIVHRAADSIVQGIYQQLDPNLATRYRGCLIGCTLPAQEAYLGRDVITPASGWHGAVEAAYGIPRFIAYELDLAFEGIPEEACADFAVASIEAIPVGADLGTAHARYTLTLLEDPDRGLAATASSYGADFEAARVLTTELVRRWAVGELVSEDEMALVRRRTDGVIGPFYGIVGGYGPFASDIGHYVFDDEDVGSAHDWWTWASGVLLDVLRASPVRG